MAESHRDEIAKLEALYAGNPGGRVFVHLAEAYRKAGEHERARRILEEGLARHADSASGYVVLGRVLADMQIVADAEAAFRRVLELDGGNLVALRWLGDLARQNGRSAEAAAHYRDLLMRNPSNEEVRDLVEIIERDTSGAAPVAQPGGRDAGPDAAAGVVEARDEPAVAAPISAEEERAVTAPPAAEPPAASGLDDVTPWSAAPGSAGEAEESPVEFGLVEIQALEEVAPEEPARGPVAEADLVASVEDDDVPLELDELSRDDEAEPVEIHLLDPSFEPEPEPEEVLEVELDLSTLQAPPEEETPADVGIDLTDLASVAEERIEGDYADDEFLADLVAATPEEPPAEALSADSLDVLDDTSPLTLLGTDEEEAPPAAEPPVTEAVVEDEIEGAAGFLDFTEPEEPVLYDQDMDFGEPAWTEPAGYAEPDAGEEVLELTEERWSPPAEPALEPATPAEAFEPAVEEPMLEATRDEATFEPSVDEEVIELTDVARADLAGTAEPAREAGTPRGMRSAELLPGIKPGESGLVTETMALLYRSQGFHDRAADVYRALLRQRPGDQRLAERLREVEEAAGASGAVEEESGEVWLRGVGAAWTADDTEAAATPYAWTAEPDEADAGEPIGSYLLDLVSWKPGHTRWTSAQAPAAPASPPPAPPAPPAPPPAAVQWADAAAEEVGSWAPQPRAQPPAEPPATEPVEDVPADPWLTGIGGPVAAPEPPAGMENPAAEWTPFDLEPEDPVPGPSRGQPPVSPARPAALDEAADEDTEDEDLEMFRSWLQSLKK